MSQSSPRFDPLQILDSDWRNRVWKGWLRSRWLGVEDVPPPAPEGDVAKTMAPPPLVPKECAMATPAVPPLHEVATRRNEVRARLDGLVDRLGSVEDNLESLVKRFALNMVHQRRHEQRLVERIDTSAEMLERQMLALEAMQASVERVEQRLARLERRWSGDGTRADGTRPEAMALGGPKGQSGVELRENRSAPQPNEYEDYSDLEDALAFDSVSGGRATLTESAEHHDTSPLSGPSIHGNLSEMSLGTVLAMLELERRTGLLQVNAEDGSTVTATLRKGAIVGARRRDVDADPVEVVREALRFKNGHFWFRQSGVEVASGPPRSVGSVLLEASSRNDEAARAS